MMGKEFKKFIRLYGGVLVSLVMILVAAGGTWWGLVPFGKSIWDMYNERQTVLSRVSQLDQKYQALTSISETDLRSQSNELLRAIPSEKTVGTLISTIESAALSSGVSVPSLTVVGPGSIATEAAERQTREERELGAGILSAGVTIEGPISQVKQALETYTKIRRTLNLKSVALSFEETGLARANIVIDGYWSPLPTTLPNVIEPLVALTPAQEGVLNRIQSYPVSYDTEIVTPLTFPARSNPFSL